MPNAYDICVLAGIVQLHTGIPMQSIRLNCYALAMEIVDQNISMQIHQLSVVSMASWR